MSDEEQIKHLEQHIFYHRVIKKIINFVNGQSEEIKLENPKVKIECKETNNFNNLFSEIKSACLINKDETFLSEDLEINPNQFNDSVENGVLDISPKK